LQVLLDQDRMALAAPVRIEILVGAQRRDVPVCGDSSRALPVYYPTTATWQLIDEWIDRTSAIGERFGFADSSSAHLPRSEAMRCGLSMRISPGWLGPVAGAAQPRLRNDDAAGCGRHVS